jgi:ferredoxin
MGGKENPPPNSNRCTLIAPFFCLFIKISIFLFFQFVVLLMGIASYATLGPERVKQEQYKKRTIARMRTALLATSAWGILETTLLRSLGYIGKFIPHAARWFMLFAHGRFGGVVTPFENALQADPRKRTWNTREEWKRTDKKGEQTASGVYLRRGEVTILPNQEILNLALRSNIRPTIAYCFCRLYAKEQGHQCELNAPLDTCMTFALPQAVDEMASNEPKAELVANQKEIYNLLKKCDDIGLVHQVVFIPSPNYSYVLCNCCPDCCEVLANFRDARKYRERNQKAVDRIEQKIEQLKQTGGDRKTLKQLESSKKYYLKGAQRPLSPLEVRSVFVAEQIDPKACNDCGICAKRCYFESRTMAHGKMHFDQAACYGCGLCVSKCPKNNIRLVKRPKTIMMAQKGQGIAHIHPHEKGHQHYN